MSRESIRVAVVSRKNDVLEALEGKRIALLEAWGNQAVSYAKNNLREAGRIDTGLLRNSITHAISGQEPNIKNYRADNPSKYSPKKNKESGSYEGTAPADPKPETGVYIGTNVEYAVYVEEGTDRMAPCHFLQRAITDHKDTYASIAKKYLEG